MKDRFPEEFAVGSSIKRYTEEYKPGDILVRFHGYTYGTLSHNEEAYARKGEEKEGPFVGFTLQAIEEAIKTEEDSEEQLRKEAHKARRKTIKASENVEKARIQLQIAEKEYSQALEEDRAAWDRLLETRISTK